MLGSYILNSEVEPSVFIPQLPSPKEFREQREKNVQEFCENLRYNRLPNLLIIYPIFSISPAASKAKGIDEYISDVTTETIKNVFKNIRQY